MKAYRIIDKRERNAKRELKLHTFEQLKESFKPGEDFAEDCPELAAKFEDILDILDLEDWLEEQAAGMVQPFEFEEVEVENADEIRRANEALKNIYIY